MSGSISTDAPEPDQCVANIGLHQQRRRLAGAEAGLYVALFSTGILLLARVPRVWLLVVAFPLWVAGSGFFQYREKT
jgi:hypothetical protein